MNERPSLRIPERVRRLAAAVALTAYLVLTALGASLVVCHEADGQVALEWSGADCCAELGDAGADGGAAAGSLSSPTGGADCVECVDLPATKILTSTGEAGQRAPVAKPDPASCAPAIAARPETWTNRAEILRRGPLAPPSPPPRLAMLRTVVFRC